MKKLILALTLAVLAACGSPDNGGGKADQPTPTANGGNTDSSNTTPDPVTPPSGPVVTPTEPEPAPVRVAEIACTSQDRRLKITIFPAITHTSRNGVSKRLPGELILNSISNPVRKYELTTEINLTEYFRKRVDYSELKAKRTDNPERQVVIYFLGLYTKLILENGESAYLQCSKAN